MSESIAAVNADVVWRTNTREATVDIERLRREFHESTQQMSTDALKLASAQDKLDKALIRHGKDSDAARRAEVQLRAAMTQSTAAAEKHASAVGRDERQLERLSRGALVGSGALRGFARTVAFASTSFLGGFGLVYALRQFISQASTLQEETEKTGVVFGDSAEEVQKWSRTLALSFGVGEGAALKAAGTFGNMFHSLHIGQADAAAMSKRLVELAADMASFNNASPEDTLKALSSGLAGQVRPLRQFGVFLSQDRIKAEAVADGISKTGKHLDATQKLLASYNIILKDTSIQQGDVARNTESLSVAESKLRAELENNEAIIGRKLLPVVTDVTNRTAKWLGKSENQRRIQRDVNEAIRAGTGVVHGFAEGLDEVRKVAGPVTHALGGVENTAKLMIEAFAVYKLARITQGIRGIGRAAVVTTGQLDGMTAAEGRAAAGGGAGGAGKAGGLTVFGKALLIGAGIIGYPYAKELFEQGFGASFAGTTGGDIASPAALRALAVRYAKQMRRAGYSDAQIRAELSQPRQSGGPIGAHIAFSDQEIDYALGHQTSGEDVALRGADARTPSPKGSGGGGTGRKHGFTVPKHFLIDEARAAAEGTKSDVIKTDKAELAYIRAQIKAGHLNKDGLIDAYNEEDRLNNEIDSIVSERRKKAANRAKKRQSEREKAAAAALAQSNRDHTPDLIERFLATRAKNAAYKNKHATPTASKSIFDEAADEFRIYGSNVGDVLSGQDARGLLGAILLELRDNTRHTKTTAKTNTKIANHGSNPAKTAAALADVGAWTQ